MNKDHDIYIDLKNSIYKDCANLNYWDGYFCGISCEKDNNPSRNEKVFNVKKCDSFKERTPGAYDFCKSMNKYCFWCMNCKPFVDNMKTQKEVKND